MDTNHRHAVDTHQPQVGLSPVEADGISYRGLLWFVIVLVGSAVLIHGGMYVMFRVFNHQVRAADPARPPLAAPAGQKPPAPNLLYELSGTASQNEPGYLKEFRDKEDAVLNGYSVDKSAGTAKISIERAKELLLQRGLPSRQQGAAAATPAPAPAKK